MQPPPLPQLDGEITETLATPFVSRVPDRLFYELGWDFAAHGVGDPDGVVPDDFRHGYAEALQHFGKKRLTTDRYIRKWLQVRLNAARRGLMVEEGVTPDYLRAIDTAWCPVTRITLTHATGEPTDWSVDRLRSDGAYCVGNLYVMAVSVNLIKGSLPLDALARRALGMVADTRLDVAEWRRLYTLVLGASEAAGANATRPLTALADVPRPGYYMLPEHVLQYAILINLKGGVGTKLRNIKSLLPYSAQRSYHRLVKRLRKHADRFTREQVKRPWFWLDLFTDEGTLDLLAQTIESAGAGWLEKHDGQLRRSIPFKLDDDPREHAGEFHLDSRGRYPTD